MGRRPAILAALIIGLLGLAGTGTYNYLRPVEQVPATRLVGSVERLAGSPPNLPWPTRGSAAVGATEVGLIASSGGARPLPIASVAKAMTSLVLVEALPLEGDATGPVVQVTQPDVDLYTSEKAEQSTVAVRSGEQLTERQLLQGLLIPSANNFAELVARVMGLSPQDLVARLNSRAVALGMARTHFADASGFNGQTVSTAEDLIRLGMEFLSLPVLAQIVALPQADLPVAGTVYNVDYALGKAGIMGIKTGSSGDAGACFLFAAQQLVSGGEAVIIGAVLGVATLDAAFEAAQKLIQAAAGGFSRGLLVPAGLKVATYRAPWGSQAGVIPARDVSGLRWPGLLLHREVRSPNAMAPLAEGSPAGRLVTWVGEGPRTESSLVTDAGLFPPGRTWRLLRLPSAH